LNAVSNDVTVPITVLRRGVAPTWQSTTVYDPLESVHEIQSIKTTNTGGSGNTILSGTFDILVGGPGYATCTTCTLNSGSQHVVTVHNNITAHDLKHELERLEVIGRVDVSHVQRGLPSLGSEWRITFLTAARNLPPLNVDGTNLVGTGAAVVAATEVEGTWPGKDHVMPSLTVGKNYYTQVRGRNVVGLGSGTSLIQNVGRGMIPVSQTVRQQPARPDGVSLFAISSSQLELRWNAADDVGDSVDKYLVEWWSTGQQTNLPLGVHETKYVRINNTLGDTQGYFTLSFNDETTARMEHNVEPMDMKLALEIFVALRKFL
jgi:hypothetical protein